VSGKFFLRSNALILSKLFLLVLQKPFIYIKNAATRTFCRYDPKRIRKILFVRLDHIGDAVMSLALVDILRSNFPSAAIHVLAAPWNFEIFHRDSRVDKVYSFSASWHNRKNDCFEERDLIGGFGLVAKNSKLINSLKSEGYDLAIDSRGDFFDSLMAYESGARFVIGSVGWFYNTMIFDNSFLLTHVVDYGDTMKHISALHADIAEKLECKFSRTQLIPNILVSKSNQDNIRKIFGDLGIDISNLNKTNIAFQICAGEKSRQWPKKNFEELALRIGKIYGNKVNLFFSGSSSEKNANQEVCEKLSSKGAFNVYNVAGTFSVANLPAFFKEMDLLITNDTGPMHIANAVGVKIIALFKGIFAQVHAPVGSNNVIISTKRDSDDMSTITVLEVIDVVTKSIK
jgi:ADP-heptose:LPS heptosyltransferase